MNEQCRSIIRVASALENPLMRQGIAALIGGLPDMEWVGDAADALQIADRIQDQTPDVVLIDLQLRALIGLTVIREIRLKTPGIEVIALSAYSSEAQARGAIRAGAKGFAMKDALPEELAEMIRAVHAGQTRLPPDIVRFLARSLTEYELSSREIEVLRLLAECSANKVIAAQMSISEGTVKVHVKHILEKMGARDRTQAVVMGIKQGLIPV